jgi:hypothetical protein
MTDTLLDAELAELDIPEIAELEISDTKPAPPPVPAVIASAFRYDQITPTVATEARDAAGRIRELFGDMKTSVAEIGHELIAIKAKLGHGEFGKWIEAEFRLTDKSAQRYINVAQAFAGRNDIVSVLPDTVAYKLAAPSTPTAIKEAVIAEIDAGNTPAPKDILNRIDAAKKTQSVDEAQADQIARKTEGKTPEEAKRITAKLEAAKAKKIAAWHDRGAKQQQAAMDCDQAAHDAVALLKQHLGAELPKFAKLYKVAGPSFIHALHDAVSPCQMQL